MELFLGFDEGYPIGLYYTDASNVLYSANTGEHLEYDIGELVHITDAEILEKLAYPQTNRLFFVYLPEGDWYILDADEERSELFYVLSNDEKHLSDAPVWFSFFSLIWRVQQPLTQRAVASRKVYEQDLQRIFKEMRKRRQGLLSVYYISRELTDLGLIESTWDLTSDLKRKVEYAFNLREPDEEM